MEEPSPPSSLSPSWLTGVLQITFLLSLARLAFIPLLLFCNISPANRHLTKVAFQSDAVFIILNILFSLSNGYIVNICMMSGRLAIIDNIVNNFKLN